MDYIKNMSNMQKRQLIHIIVYAVFFIAAVLIGTLGMKQPIVALCFVFMLETAIAVCLHNLELWIHGAVILVQLIVAVLIPRVGIMILSVLLYAVTLLVLKAIIVVKKS